MGASQSLDITATTGYDPQARQPVFSMANLKISVKPAGQ